MIFYIKGKIRLIQETFIVIENNNIGYEIFVSEALVSKIKVNNEIQLFTHQYVKEDVLALYGFEDFKELKLFKQLISISGIGPKSAINIFSIANIDDITASIASADTSVLTKVSGICKKTSQRIIIAG